MKKRTPLNPTINRRMALALSFKGLLSVLIIGRVVNLQIQNRGKYQTLSNNNRVVTKLLAPLRGDIYDRNGKALATNINYNLLGLDISNFDHDDLAKILRQGLKLNDQLLQDIRDEIESLNDPDTTYVLDDYLDEEALAYFAVKSSIYDGMHLISGFKRHYPIDHAATHVLGYISALHQKPDKDILEKNPELKIPGLKVGRTGLEKLYDKTLRGNAGFEFVEVNAKGKVIRPLSKIDPIRGQSLNLSLSMDVQAFAYDLLAPEKSAACLVMDVQSGEIITCLSVPAPNANIFTKKIPQKLWDDLSQDPYTPLLDKVNMGLYAPGSTFKIVSALAILKAGISPEEKVFCKGYTQIGNHRFHCWQRQGHGWVNMRQALSQSCDCYFYDMSQKVGIDALYSMGRIMGLGAKAAGDYESNQAGILPNPDWKMKRFKQPWFLGDTAQTYIGQGYITTNIAQLCQMTTILCTGNLVPASMIKNKLGVRTKINIKEEHLQLVRQALQDAVVQEGGTAGGAKSSKITIAGKTGTSQVRRISLAERQDGVKNNEALEWQQRDHALFVGYAPADKPKWAISLIIEHGGGGGYKAAPLAKAILEKVKETVS